MFWSTLRARFPSSLATFALVALFLTSACDPGPEPLAPDANHALVDGGFASMGSGRTLSWSFFGADSRVCSDPVFSGQNQSVYPLNARGSRILVGQSGCPPERYNYVVFDVTDTGIQFVDGIHVPPTLGSGFETAAHSPEGSEVAFGAEGDVLVTWDGSSFSLEELDCSSACTINDVWATSPSHLWAVTREGQILSWNDGTVAEEATGLGFMWSVAASPGRRPALVVAGGSSGVWVRERNGSWSLSMDSGDHSCGGVIAVSVASPREAWANTSTCVFRFDGTSWSEVTKPGGGSLFGLAAIAPGQVVVGGQGGVASFQDPLHSTWASSDGGTTWTQLSDAAFTGANLFGDHGTFDLSVSHGGQKLFVAGINTLMWVGSASGGGSLVAEGPSMGPGAPVLKAQGSLSSRVSSDPIPLEMN